MLIISLPGSCSSSSYPAHPLCLLDDAGSFTSHFSRWIRFLHLLLLLLLHHQMLLVNTHFPLLPLTNPLFSLPTLLLPLLLLLLLLLLPSLLISPLLYSLKTLNQSLLPGNFSESPLPRLPARSSWAALRLSCIAGGGTRIGTLPLTRRLSDPIVVSGCSRTMRRTVTEEEIVR